MDSALCSVALLLNRGRHAAQTHAQPPLVMQAPPPTIEGALSLCTAMMHSPIVALARDPSYIPWLQGALNTLMPLRSSLPPRTTELPFVCQHLLLHTSGSTGHPKGVLLHLAGIEQVARASALDADPSCRFGLSLSLGHIAGVLQLFRALVSRAHLVASRTVSGWAQEETTHLALVPTQLLQAEEADLQLLAASPLRTLYLGGGAVTAPCAARLDKVPLPVRQTYALSEASGTCAMSAHNTLEPLLPLEQTETQLREGRIWIRSPGLATALYQQKRWVELPRDPAGFWASPDQGREVGNGFVWERRLDRSFKSGGLLLHPEAMEAWLHQFSPWAWVIPYPHIRWGQRPLGLYSPDLSLDPRALLPKMAQDLGGRRYACDRLIPAPAAWLTRPKVSLEEGRMYARAYLKETSDPIF